jgi:RHS repeat-associated protein
VQSTVQITSFVASTSTTTEAAPYAYLTASLDGPLDGGLTLAIYDDTGARAWSCVGASVCEARVRPGVNETRSYTAYIVRGSAPVTDGPTGVVSSSDGVSVANIGVGSDPEGQLQIQDVTVMTPAAFKESPWVTVAVSLNKEIISPLHVAVYDNMDRLVGACTSAYHGTFNHCKLSDRLQAGPARSYTAYIVDGVPPQEGGPGSSVVGFGVSSGSVVLGSAGAQGLAINSVAVMPPVVQQNNPWVTVAVSLNKEIISPLHVAVYDNMDRLVGACTSTYYGTFNHCKLSDRLQAGPARSYTAYIVDEAPPQEGGPGSSVVGFGVSSGSVVLGSAGAQGLAIKSVAVMTPVVQQNNPWVTVAVSLNKEIISPLHVAVYDNMDRLVGACTSTYYGTFNHCKLSDRLDGGLARVYTAYIVDGPPPSAGGPGAGVVARSAGVGVAQAGGPGLPGETRGGSNPSQSSSQRCHCDPVNSFTGEFWETSADLEVAGTGPGLSWSRSFATTRASWAGSLGFGWSSGYDLQLRPQGSSSLTSAGWVDVVQENGSVTTFTAAGEGYFVAPLRVFATLERLDDGSYRFVRRSSQTFIFDSAGHLTRIEDRNGNATSLERDADGRLIRVVDDNDRALDILWSGARIASVTDSTGRAVSYKYSAAGDLTRVRLPDGAVKAYSYDSTHRVVSLVHPDGGITRNEYDSSNRVVSQKDPLGRVTTFVYGTGQTTVTDPAGMVTVEKYVDAQVTSETKGAGTPLAAATTFTYGPTNQVESTTDPLGRVTRFTYDARGNRTSVTDPLGRTSTTTYDAFNNPLVVTNAAGEATTFTYDDRGNPLSMTDPTGAVTAFTANPDGTVATATDPTGGVTTFTYDAHGFVASLTGPDGAVVTTVRDALGRVEASTDPRGSAPGSTAGEFTSTFTYDAAGRRLTSTDPLGAVVASAYDAAGRPTSVTDATGATTTTEYDAAGQVTAVVDAAGAGTAFTYDGAGRVTSVTDASGAVTETTYDVLGRATAVTDPLGGVTRTEYDAGDRVVATVSPSGARTTYTYDDADQLLTVTDPRDKVTTTTYDRAGRPVTVTDADGRKVTTTYDRAGRPVKVLRADGSALLWEYDPAGRVTATVDAAGERTTYTYDAAGRRASATDTAGRTTTFAYDAAGLLTSLTQPDGAVTTYDHDAAGRRTATDYSDGTPDESTVYDLAGRPTAVTDGSGTTTYAYDAVGRVTRVAQGSTEVGYAWDAVGRLTDLTYPSGEQVRRAYDAAGQLTTVTDWADRVFTYGYDADGLTTEVAYPNGVTTDVDLDAAGQAVAMTTSANGIDLLELAYGYTDAGLLADQATTRSTQSRAPPASASTSSTYTWDGLARIAEVEGHGAGVFAFDAAGSVTTLADGRTLSYDAARQLQSLTASATTPGGDPSTTTYSYDARGNRLAATTGSGDDATNVEHVYDQANRLTSVTTADGTATSYTYGPGGLRATATTGTVTEYYTWDTLAGVPLLLADATFAYVYGNGSVPLAQVDLADGDVDYLHADTLGSVRSTTDATGAVTSDADYDPYGRPEAPTSDPTAQVTRFGYAGEYTDPTGYLYLRARYYDPGTAQFLTLDPVVELSQSPYGYTGGNPLQHTDPLGLIDWNLVAAIAVGGAVVTLFVACVASVICGAVATAGVGTSLALTASAGTVASVATAGALVAGGASVAVQQHEANTWFSRANGAESRGTPRTNSAQNRQFKDAVSTAERRLGRKLNKAETRRLHEEITGRNYDFHEIVEEACAMFGG